MKIDVKDIKIENAEALEKDKSYVFRFKVSENVSREAFEAVAKRFIGTLQEKGINCVAVAENDDLKLESVKVKDGI